MCQATRSARHLRDRHDRDPAAAPLNTVRMAKAVSVMETQPLQYNRQPGLILVRSLDDNLLVVADVDAGTKS